MAIEFAEEAFLGNDLVLRFTVEDADGAAVNITGWTFAFALARSYSVAAAISKSSGAGIAINDGAAGIVDVTVQDTDTDDLDVGAYVADLKRADAGQEATLAYGRLKLLPSVAA